MLREEHRSGLVAGWRISCFECGAVLDAILYQDRDDAARRCKAIAADSFDRALDSVGIPADPLAEINRCCPTCGSVQRDHRMKGCGDAWHPDTREDSSAAQFCEHANEAPQACPCDDDCYCRTHTCKPREVNVPIPILRGNETPRMRSLVEAERTMECYRELARAAIDWVLADRKADEAILKASPAEVDRQLAAAREGKQVRARDFSADAREACEKEERLHEALLEQAKRLVGRLEK